MINGYDELIKEFGDPTQYITDDGRVMPQWEYEQLGMARLPLPVFLAWDKSKTVEKIYCHRKMIPVFEDVFHKIHVAGLWSHVQNYGGCYNWRMKRTAAKLSTHCWGIAIDINPATNGLGTKGDQNQEVVDIFEDAGFSWGGRWTPLKNRDDMHFQFCNGY